MVVLLFVYFLCKRRVSFIGEVCFFCPVGFFMRMHYSFLVFRSFFVPFSFFCSFLLFLAVTSWRVVKVVWYVLVVVGGGLGGFDNYEQEFFSMSMGEVERVKGADLHKTHLEDFADPPFFWLVLTCWVLAIDELDQGVEDLVDIYPLPGWRLEEGHAPPWWQLIASFPYYYSVFFQITFVPNEDNRYLQEKKRKESIQSVWYFVGRVGLDWLLLWAYANKCKHEHDRSVALGRLPYLFLCALCMPGRGLCDIFFMPPKTK